MQYLDGVHIANIPVYPNIQRYMHGQIIITSGILTVVCCFLTYSFDTLNTQCISPCDPDMHQVRYAQSKIVITCLPMTTTSKLNIFRMQEFDRSLLHPAWPALALVGVLRTKWTPVRWKSKGRTYSDFPIKSDTPVSNICDVMRYWEFRRLISPSTLESQMCVTVVI